MIRLLEYALVLLIGAGLGIGLTSSRPNPVPPPDRDQELVELAVCMAGMTRAEAALDSIQGWILEQRRQPVGYPTTVGVE